MAESASYVRLAAQASTVPPGDCPPAAAVRLRRIVCRMPVVEMGDIGEEVTEIELEPLPEEVPAGVPAEPAAEPAPA